jgi:hypothetical protein
MKLNQVYSKSKTSNPTYQIPKIQTVLILNLRALQDKKPLLIKSKGVIENKDIFG